jgi:hypothetical protein
MAGRTRFRHLKMRTTNTEDITDANRILTHTSDRQVFTKGAKIKRLVSKFRRPISIILMAKGVDSHVGPTVGFEIALGVTVDIQAPHGDPARHRLLEDRRGISAPPIGDLTWLRNIDRFKLHLGTPQTRTALPLG